MACFGVWGQAGSPWGWKQMLAPGEHVPAELGHDGSKHLGHSWVLSHRGRGETHTQASSYTRLLGATIWTGMWCLQVCPVAFMFLLVCPSAPCPCQSILQAGVVQRLVPSFSKPGDPLLYPMRGAVHVSRAASPLLETPKHP